SSVPAVHLVDLRVLLREAFHREPARDRQPVRVVGDRAVFVASRNPLVDDVLERLAAVAPGGVHLEIAAILRARRPGERRVIERSEYPGARQEVLTPHPALFGLRDIPAGG